MYAHTHTHTYKHVRSHTHIQTHRRAAIHAEAPEFSEMSTEQEILVTGIKVVDLLAPYAKGGKIGKTSFLFVCLFVCLFVVLKSINCAQWWI